MLDRLLCDDLLKAVVDMLPSDDLLPAALSYRRMGRACILCVHRGAKAGPRWITCITASVPRVKWALDMGYEPSEAWCKAAAARGDLVTLQWLRAYGAPWGGATFVAATERGHLHILEYLHEHRCPDKYSPPAGDVGDRFECQSAFDQAARSGQLSALAWLHAHGYTWDQETWGYATCSDNLDSLQWLYQNNDFHPRPRDTDTDEDLDILSGLVTAFSDCDTLECLSWIDSTWTSNGEDGPELWDSWQSSNCANLELVMEALKSAEYRHWLLQRLHLATWHDGKLACATAAWNGDLQGLQLLREHGCPWDKGECTRWASEQETPAHAAVREWILLQP